MSCSDTCAPPVHVGDIGTQYQMEVCTSGDTLDFMDADLAELIFQMPNGAILRKTATVSANGSPATSWTLSYTVEPGDGIGSPGEFHDNDGPYSIQAYLHWADGRQFHSTIETQDSDGEELRIFPNLD